ncbi:PREDICTED: uncharacterized protein LOC104593682 [Nelumbo nucifera]|uniref:Uncharacterized protein LOC104593682 n=2 Tax=Nelumbo nucifera TaxID=4432 RepID=A0A1U7ZSV9_NELNU|nr:PREDICTED: uncharacterized protein LOC104593682 [Nelumbo nucifera]DAD43222.1 TPA_asm: hypothetical protein HUJ06_001452 [Nelumbo nucifera]
MDHAHPLTSAVRHDRSDEEAGPLRAKQLSRKKNIKCFAYIAVFAVFQTIIILVFALTVLKIKAPSVKLSSVSVESISLPNGASSPFRMTVTAQVAVKNKNFGHFKFDNSTATLTYRSVTVGEAVIPEARAKARKTRRMNVTMEVSSESLSIDGSTYLNSDIRTGNLTLNSYARLSGKVHLMKIMKKRKTAEMNCTITVNLEKQTVQELNCQ